MLTISIIHAVEKMAYLYITEDRILLTLRESFYKVSNWVVTRGEGVTLEGR